MLIKYFQLVLLSIVISLISNPIFAQKTYSLEECVQIALQNNIQTKQQNLQTESAKIDVNQSKFSALPNLNAPL